MRLERTQVHSERRCRDADATVASNSRERQSHPASLPRRCRPAAQEQACYCETAFEASDEDWWPQGLRQDLRPCLSCGVLLASSLAPSLRAPLLPTLLAPASSV